MFDPSWQNLAVIALAFAAGGLVKGVVGLGLPMIAVPVIGSMMDPRSAIATMIIPILGSNLIQALRGGHGIDTPRRIAGFLIPLIAGSVCGVLLLTSLPTTWVALILAALVSLFSVLILVGWKPVLPPGIERRIRVPVGLVAGLTGGMSSFFGPTVVPYLISLGLPAGELVRAMGWVFLLGELPVFLGLAVRGYAPPLVWMLSAAGWAVVTLAMAAGSRLRSRMSESMFMRLVGSMLLLIGLNMIRRVVF